jgi:hypothetical protein
MMVPLQTFVRGRAPRSEIFPLQLRRAQLFFFQAAFAGA